MTLKMTLKWTAVLGVVFLAAQVFAEEPLVLKTRTDKESYTTGVTMVRTLRQQGGEVNLDIVIKGMMDGLTGQNLLMTEEDLSKTMAALQTELMQRQKQAAIKRNEMKATAVGNATTGNPGLNNDAAAQPLPERPEQHLDQSGMLASTEPAGSATRTASAGPMVRQTRGPAAALNGQGNELTPDGRVMSWRSKAKISVNEMKQEMRARAASDTMQQ